MLIETFILFEDKVGLELQQRADRGRRSAASTSTCTVDGWGSPDLSDAYVGALTDAGVRLRAFDPSRDCSALRLHLFRRMHRKIVVVDGRVAFVGGINFSADHLGDFGPEAKQDYAVRIAGPLVDRRSAASRWRRSSPGAAPRQLADLAAPPPARRRDVRDARQPPPPRRDRAPVPRRDPQRAARGD